MTRKYFSRLSKPAQYRNLIQRGVCIAERSVENTLLLLFQLDSFYVEVTFDNDSDDIITTRNFDNIAELEPYLRNIALPAT